MKNKKFILYAIISIILALGVIKIINLGLTAYKLTYNFIDDPVKQNTYFSLTVPRTSAEPDMKTWVLNYIEEQGLNRQDINQLIECESKWNDWAYNFNTNKSSDFGLWQINSIHKNTISVENRFDYKKATTWAVEKIKRDGNMCAWTCAKCN